eukprot:5560508-Alexandrium_andersonii.AAC.1
MPGPRVALPHPRGSAPECQPPGYPYAPRGPAEADWPVHPPGAECPHELGRPLSQELLRHQLGGRQ